MVQELSERERIKRKKENRRKKIRKEKKRKTYNFRKTRTHEKKKEKERKKTIVAYSIGIEAQQLGIRVVDLIVIRFAGNHDASLLT